MSLGNGGRIERGVCGFTTLGSLSGLGGLDGGLRPRLFLAALRHLLPDAVEDRTAGGVSGRMPGGARGGFGAGLRDDGGAFVLVDVVRRLASCDRLFVANLSADAEDVGHGLTEAFGGDLGVVEDAGVFVGRHSPEVFGLATRTMMRQSCLSSRAAAKTVLLRTMSEDGSTRTSASTRWPWTRSAGSDGLPTMAEPCL